MINLLKKLSGMRNSDIPQYLAVTFRGGPANRFFEYHTATYLAERWNKIFVYDPGENLSAGMHHDDQFDIRTFFDCSTLRIPEYDTVIRQFDKRGVVDPHWKEKLLKMSEPKGNVLLTDGWYQTFWDNHITVPKLSDYSVPCDLKKTVFIHVRRNDYLESRLFVDLKNYYYAAYSKMERLVPNSSYLICSDDPAWCKCELHYINDAYFLENTDYKTTLAIMSECKKGAILSNSTFGLWGAYLANINTEFASSFTTIVPNPWLPVAKENIGISKYIVPSWATGVSV